MDVEAHTHPGCRRRCPPAQQGPGQGQVVGGGDLEVAGVPGHDLDPPARGFDQGGVVGGLGLALVGPPQGRGQEGLGRLHGHQPGSVQGVDDGRARGALDGVRRAHAGDGAVGPRAHGGDHGPEQGGPGQGTAAVVHDHHVGVVGDQGQPGPHRRRPRRPPGHRRRRRRGGARGCHRVGCFARPRGEDDDDAVAGVRGRGHRPVQDATVTQGCELLGPAEALPGAGGDDHGPHAGGPAALRPGHGPTLPVGSRPSPAPRTGCQPVSPRPPWRRTACGRSRSARCR